MQITIDVNVPESYRYKGFGVPTRTDYILGNDGKMISMRNVDTRKATPCMLFELIIPEIKGREPKDPDDVGKMIYVRDFEHDRWKQRRFVGIEDFEFATFDSEHSFETWEFAMIEEPAKEEKPKYRPATADDVGKEVEFTDDKDTDWIPDVLGAYNSIRRFKYKSEETGLWWQFARVKV